MVKTLPLYEMVKTLPLYERGCVQKICGSIMLSVKKNLVAAAMDVLVLVGVSVGPIPQDANTLPNG